jgi:hypothetical protein
LASGVIFLPSKVTHCFFFAEKKPRPPCPFCRLEEVVSDKLNPLYCLIEAPEQEEVKKGYFFSPDEEGPWEGPYSTEHEAVESARETVRDRRTFWIKRAERVRPEDAVNKQYSLDEFLERLELYASNVLGAENTVFRLRYEAERNEAEKALKGVLMIWARRFLSAAFYTAKSFKEVPLQDEEEL